MLERHDLHNFDAAVAELRQLADTASVAGDYATGASIAGALQTLRAIASRGVAATELLKETDAILSLGVALPEQD